MLKDTMAKWFAKVERDHPLGRLGTPEEVSNCIVFYLALQPAGFQVLI